MTDGTASAAIFDDAPIGLAKVGSDGTWLQVNRQLCDFLGYSEDRLQKMRFHDVTYPDDLPADVAQVERLLEHQGGSYNIPKRYVRSDGSVIHADLNVRFVKHANGSGHFISSVQDLSQIHQRIAQLERFVRQDPLTRVCNRVGFFENLRESYRDYKRFGRGFALAYLDLDGFKAINDTLGHLTGDMLLRAVAERMVSAAGPHGLSARLGGDEFIIIFNDVSSPDRMQSVLKRLHAMFSVPFLANGQTVSITASIGFAHCPTDARALRELLEFADTKMYETKRATFQTDLSV